LDLPFDVAQGYELVEQFRISCFEFRILHISNEITVRDTP